MFWLFGKKITEPPAKSRWQYLPKDLISRDEFVTIEHRPEFMGDSEYRRDFEAHSVGSRILVRIEPPVVNPWQHRARVSSEFGLVITESSMGLEDDWIAGYFSEESATLAQHHSRKFPLASRPSDAVAVMANKFSLVRGELYTLRRKVWASLASSHPGFTLFGRDWDLSAAELGLKLFAELSIALRSRHLPSMFEQAPLKVPAIALGGSLGSPHDGYTLGKIAVVIENYPNRVTEKIFQAIESGCQVVYVGGQAAWIDDSKPLVFRAEANVPSILSAIAEAKESQSRGSAMLQDLAHGIASRSELQMKPTIELLSDRIMKFLT